MGLDAVVYTSLKRLPPLKGTDAHARRVGQRTGEVYFAGEDVLGFRQGDVVALKKRLGNVSLVAALRAEIGLALGHDCSSVLLSKVLRNGTHSGDVITGDDLDLLNQELSTLKRQKKQGSSELRQFIIDMRELVLAAQQNGNPIVFV